MKKKVGHLPSCTKLVEDLNSKISPFKVAYFLVARPEKILPVTLKSAKIFFILSFVKVAPESKCVP